MRGFGGLLRGSIRRDVGPLLVSGLGIMIGVAALVFFLRLGLGAKEHVFEGLMGQLPVGTLELKAEKGTALLGFWTGSQTKGLGPTIAEPPATRRSDRTPRPTGRRPRRRSPRELPAHAAPRHRNRAQREANS